MPFANAFVRLTRRNRTVRHRGMETRLMETILIRASVSPRKMESWKLSYLGPSLSGLDPVSRNRARVSGQDRRVSGAFIPGAANASFAVIPGVVCVFGRFGVVCVFSVLDLDASGARSPLRSLERPARLRWLHRPLLLAHRTLCAPWRFCHTSCMHRLRTACVALQDSTDPVRFLYAQSRPHGF